MGRRWTVVVAVLAVLAVPGCSLSVPADPHGTLDRVRGGVLRVGVSPRPPWTDVAAAGTGGTGSGSDDAGSDDAAAGAQPSGIEVDLARDFARSLDAEVHWTTGGEQALVADLEEGRLDLVVGGLTADSPWVDHAALTRPYVTVPGPDGRPEPHVMAAPMGENAFLVALERFLLRQDVPEVPS